MFVYNLNLDTIPPVIRQCLTTYTHSSWIVSVPPSVRHSYREQHKVLLISFAHTVVHPRAMVVHFADASLAYGAVVSAFRFYGAAFGALEEHLALPQIHRLYGGLGRVTLGYGSLQ